MAKASTKLLTVSQAATQLGVSEQRVRKLIADKRITAERLGERTYGIKPRDLEKFERLTGPQGGRSPRMPRARTVEDMPAPDAKASAA